MGNSSSQTSTSQKPHGGLHTIFFTSPKLPETFRRSWFASSSGTSTSAEAPVPIEPQMIQRIKRVTKVYWCSDPFNEMGRFRDLSPRTLPRWLAGRHSRGLSGPATWEGGHSYAIVDVETVSPETGTAHERYRLNWGQGKMHGTNLTMFPEEHLPEQKLTGDRLEKAWEGTCTGEELYSLLKSWDGRLYDSAPSNNGNCHHFVQDLIHQCTSDSGYALGDR
eukprot:TRINITY_DN45454_c0_g1_i1.p1 TRINITY_DN45454_c0_g1~~TRINITY_DN45454_c0_g1_i1.p1  ORF type:complete len:221 (+),score=19.78 TRINITY_DN45454_c0_g1_i1:72-734(+)